METLKLIKRGLSPLWASGSLTLERCGQERQATHLPIHFQQILGYSSSLGSFTYMFFGANAGWAIWYPSFTSL